VRITKKQVERNIRRWIKALRSGDYKQGTNSLSYNGKHCCLGVACEVFKIEKQKCVTSGGKELCVWQYKDDGSLKWARANLPDKVRQLLGLQNHDGKYNDFSLIRLNDTGHSFEQIANVIQSQPSGLFKYRNLKI